LIDFVMKLHSRWKVEPLHDVQFDLLPLVATLGHFLSLL
jgi:hypothetical protein